MAEGDSGLSLDELMKDVAAKLDELPPPKPASEPPENVLNDGDFPGLENLLTKVSKHFEEKSVNDESVEVSVSEKGEGNDTLKDLLSTLNKDIKSSNWLEEHTAEKWVQENPKLAEEYKKAAGMT